MTPKKWKFLLLLGRPLVLIGILVFVSGMSDGLQAARDGGEFLNDTHALGILIGAAGFVSAWTGKLGAYWFHG